ncbi:MULTISPECIES: hypothetical protein [Acetobacter]|nr:MULTISPECIES: hypothetical protein [Acetobacter]ANA13983.1 hypothetical protein WG31_08135 [Acetobacter oryzifermentans]ATI13155.1 hypothetical protein CPF11_12420 [Acetobacter pomorum]AXC26730.1 hypothetical protein DS739_08010 [Acetobacter sp. JWB]KAA8421567.1 hypothetical protein FKW54_12795 [Acetobacter pomorum]KAA8436635.1 hypothetical protein FKW50_04240 [Acetobacter pomorum]
MKIIRTAVAMVIIASTGACTSSGDASIKHTTLTEVNQNIHDGVTTSSQVHQIYGEPGQKGYENGYEFWVYSFTVGREDGLSIAQDVVGLGMLGARTNNKSKTLTIVFNNGIVLNHSFSTANFSSSSGIRQ